MSGVLPKPKIPLIRYLVLSLLLSVLFSCGKDDVFTSDVFIRKQWRLNLTTANVVPAISGRNDHAVGMVYLMSNNELHYQIYFDKPLENGDQPQGAKIFSGAAGQSGTQIADLNVPAFDANREAKGKLLVDDALFQRLQSEKIYFQIYSVQQQVGLVRDQLN